MRWVRQRRDRRRIHDLHELLCATFPSPGVALDRESGDDYVDLLSDVDLIEASLAGALSWGREVHRAALITALEQAVGCQLRCEPLMTETQRNALHGVVDALRVFVAPEEGLSVSWSKLDGLSALVTEGEYAGCTVTIEVPGSGVVLFEVEGAPRAGGEAFSWEASATDDLGVREWLASFGLTAAAANRLDPDR